MAFELPQRRQNIRQIQTQKRNVPIEQIIAAGSYNPLGQGIEVAGNLIGQSLQQRAAARRQGEQLARLETLAGEQPGAFSGLDSSTATAFTQLKMKQAADLKEAEAKKRDQAKMKPLFGGPVEIEGKSYQPFYNDVGEIEYKPLKGTQKKTLKDLDSYTDNASKALLAIEKIRTAGKDISDIQPGLLNQVTGRATTAYKSFTKEPKLNKYEGVVSQELIPLARSLAEEKGPITDNDVARIQKGLGDPLTPAATRTELLNELVNKIELGIQNKSQTFGVPLEDIYQRNTSLTNLLAGQKAYQTNRGLDKIVPPKPTSISPVGYSPDKEKRYEKWKQENGY